MWDFMQEIINDQSSYPDGWQKELFILFKTDPERYRMKVAYIKACGYRVLRNSDGMHKVIKK